MKAYEGGRGLDSAVVTVEGASLDPRFDICVFSSEGFGQTYDGGGPRQLAFAPLADPSGRCGAGIRLTESFVRTVVVASDNAWRLTSAASDAAIAGPSV